MSEQKMREALDYIAGLAAADDARDLTTIAATAQEALAQPADVTPLNRWMVFNVGCIECGVSSDVVGTYNTEEEAVQIAEKLGECHSWREGGQNSYEVFDLLKNPSSDYFDALAAHEAKKIGGGV